MIQLVPISNLKELNADFRQIYEEAFPPDERRNWHQLAELLTNPIFSLNGIYQEQQLIGILLIWNLDDFSFIEHFAIRDSMRGNGFGSQVIQQLIMQISNPVILEVEEPFTSDALKRITFYKRLNFSLFDGEYYQPPYSDEKNKVKMLLMSYPEKIEPEVFPWIKKRIYQTVYQLNE